MSTWTDSLELAKDIHTLLRMGGIGDVKSPTIAINKLLIDGLERMSETHDRVSFDHQDVYLILMSVNQILNRIKDCDPLCIDSLTNTISHFHRRINNG